jgi:hypothetical protein
MALFKQRFDLKKTGFRSIEELENHYDNFGKKDLLK